MREYQQKHTFRTILYSRVTIIVLFLLCVLLLRSIIDLNDKRIEMKKLHDDSLAERTELEERVQKAEEKNAHIATPRGFEEYIRTTFPVVQGDEGVIVIYDEEKSPVSDVREDLSVWEKLAVWWRNNMVK